MITMMGVFCMLLVLAFVAAVLMGIIAVSPILLVIIGLILLDVFAYKIIFKRKK